MSCQDCTGHIQLWLAPGASKQKTHMLTARSRSLLTCSSTPSEPAFPGPAGGKYLEVGDTLLVNRATCGMPLQASMTLGLAEEGRAATQLNLHLQVG